MNIEKAKKLVRGLVFNDDGTMVRYIDFTAADYDTWGGYTLKEYAEAIETLLTAYEKEKEANKKLDKEAQGYLEELAGDGSMNIRRIQELEAELEKKREK